MQKKLSLAKTITWVYSMVTAFAAAYVIGGILLEKQDKKQKEHDLK